MAQRNRDQARNEQLNRQARQTQSYYEEIGELADEAQQDRASLERNAQRNAQTANKIKRQPPNQRGNQS